MKTQTPSVFIFLAFGSSGSRSNQQMVTIASNIEPELIIAQWEIGEKIPKSISIGQRGKYIDTHFVLRDAKEKLTDPSAPIVLVAHPHHLPRCIAVAIKMGLTVDIRYSKSISGSIPYDAKSSQVWTRGPILFRLREWLIVYPLYKIKGYI